MNPVLETIQTPEFAAKFKQSLFLDELRMPVEARLRFQICDYASVALARFLQTQDINVSLVQSKSEALSGVQIDHVFIRTGENGGTIIDPTYGQFLSLAGADPINDAGLYPTPEIAVCDASDTASIIDRLSEAGESYEPNSYPRAHEIRGRMPGEFTKAISDIWRPENTQPARLNILTEQLGAFAAAHLALQMKQ